MKSLAHKFRLMLLGIFVSLSVGVIAQVGGGAGIGAEPASTTPTFDTLTVTGTSDLQGIISNSTGTVNIGDNVIVTGTTDIQGIISNSAGTVNIDDNIIVTGTTDLQGGVSDSLGTLTLNDAVDVTGALTATSYGGITEANLLDKTAGEAVTGVWALAHPLGVRSATSTDAENRVVTFEHQNGTQRAYVGHGTGNDTLTLGNQIHAGSVVISGETTAGAGRAFLNGDPDGFTVVAANTDVIVQVNDGETALYATANGAVAVYHNGSVKLATASDGVDITGTLDVSGDVAHNGNDATHATGQFTDTMSTGCTTSPTLTVDWARAGDIVTLDMDLASTCTSNAFFIEFAAALPSALRPTIEQNMLGRVTDNGSVILANVAVRSDGDIAFGATTQTGIGGLTNSGTRDVVNQTVTYQLQ